MWWPRKPQPPITRTEVESLGGGWVVAMICVFSESNWCGDNWIWEVGGEVGV